MTKVGVIGLGMMGSTHLDVYSNHPKALVVAVSDIDPAKLSGQSRAKGNIEGQAQGGFDFANVRRYDEGMKLINDPEVELVDICLPTPLHMEYACAALEAGKHVMVEKPLARNSEQADKMVECAAAAAERGQIAMPGMCVRFWPGWDWLKEVIDDGRYGRLLGLHVRRFAPYPNVSFYLDGAQCGGAIMDLHIHDTDFIQWCVGMPRRVTTQGYAKITTEMDHVVTLYDYGIDGPLVSAEGSWAMDPDLPFNMSYTANFERATAVFDSSASQPLLVYQDGKTQAISLPDGMGYAIEIDYLLDCIDKGRAPRKVTFEQAARSVRIIEAETTSAKERRTVTL